MRARARERKNEEKNSTHLLVGEGLHLRGLLRGVHLFGSALGRFGLGDHLGLLLELFGKNH